MPTALITGGGGAIALEIAVRLEARGYDLILVDFDQARMDENALKLTSPTLVRVDLSDPSEVEGLANRIESGELPVDPLVNNAGFISPGEIAASRPETLMRHVGINLTSAMRITQATVRRLLDQKKAGGVLSIVSQAGVVSLGGSAAYSASKFGLRGFLLGASLELADKGISFTQVLPGAVDTPMLRKEAVSGGSAMNFPNKDVLTASEVAQAAVDGFGKKTLEIFLPRSDRWMNRLLVAFPGLLKTIIPRMQKRGQRNRALFIRKHGLVRDAGRG